MPRLNPDLRSYLISAVANGETDVAKRASEEFGLTRQAVNHHLRALVAEGLVRESGATRARRYELASRAIVQGFEIQANLHEDRIWDQVAEPLLKGVSSNIRGICLYGFLEMANNAVDHSEGRMMTAKVEVSPISVTVVISDDGIGAFRKIIEKFELHDEREAILELTKGKLTTDPKRHSGEGIFFTSRMFDRFSLKANGHALVHVASPDAWSIENVPNTKGTEFKMSISLGSKREPKDVFDRFTEAEFLRFEVTEIPVSLAQMGEDNLVSRSQAKRLLSRVTNFKRVILDFSGIRSIGPAFSDEIFRVFTTRQPEISVEYSNASEGVLKMINRAIEARREQDVSDGDGA